MTKIIVICLLVLLLALYLVSRGCIPSHNNSVAFPQIDANDPQSIENWESSRFNVFDAKIKVVPLQFFPGKMTPTGQSQPVNVPVRLCRALSTGPAPEQTHALDDFLKNEQALYQKARQAVYRFYQNSYQDYKQGWSLGSRVFGVGDISEFLPQVVSGSELDELVQFEVIRIHPPRDGQSKIGIECSCSWDPEHGLGILIASDEIEQVGLAEVCYPIPSVSAK